VKQLNCKLYYRQLHLKYWCNCARYWLQAVWGWQDSVETCSSVIICEIIVCFCWFRVQNILQYYKIFKTLKLSYLQYNSLKSLCCYNSQSVSQCAGCIYSLYVDVTVVLAGMYWCNCARYWLQAVWGWQDSGETCSGVIICEIIMCICW